MTRKSGSWNTAAEIRREMAHVATMKVKCLHPECEKKVKNGQGWCSEHTPKESGHD